jgi:hypothetical protein
MSASKKLKALDEAATPVESGWTVSALTHIYGDCGDGVRDVLIAQANWRQQDADLVVAIRNALPQIVAVVEAASPDTEGSAHWLCMGTVTMMDGSVHPCPICVALAALDEALT